MKIIDILVMWLFFPIAGLFMLLNLVFSSDEKPSLDDEIDDVKDAYVAPPAREYAWRKELTKNEKRIIGRAGKRPYSSGI